MSQDYHNRGVFGFDNVFDRSQQQQIQRDKHRVEGFEPPQAPPRLVGIEEEESTSGIPVYETAAGMLSEMFDFQPGDEAGVVDSTTSTGLLENPRTAASAADWFLHRNPVSTINNSDSAAMQLFLSNPHQQQHQESPSPNNPPASTSSTLHMLLPNPSSHTGNFSHQFSWGGNVNNNNNPNEIHVPAGAVQGLSLSLSSSLQHLEAEEQLRINTIGGGGGDHHGGGMLFFGSSSHNNVNMLRNSKYAKPTQELLEEFCSVGYRGHHFNNNNKLGTRQQDFSYNNKISEGGTGVGNSSKEHQQPPPLSAADRLEHQRRKVKLLSMLDEVDRRYNHYCEQMHMVVNSFDMVMGFGAAVPYTTLAQKAMSRHFRCLKDAINMQLKNSCELLGEKDLGTSGVTKGETPRLRVLEQSLRQQRTFHQMGMMDQEAWRPQRGLPERSVNILRAWLFEHFLHPYPSDADKHLLARQTGLSRSQVSNWFINARVRLWKPMVEEMYQKESKEDTIEDQDLSSSSAQTPPFEGCATAITTPASITPPPPQPPHFFSENLSYNNVTMSSPTGSTTGQPFLGSGDINDSSSMIRFGTSGGDVSLTLGLRHVGELPENNPFSVSNFGGC